MSDAHLSLLVDTNVWLDFLLGRQGASDAARFIQRAMEREDVLAVMPTILKDVFFLVGATLKRRAREEDPPSEAHPQTVNEICWATLSTIQGLAVVLNVGAGEHLEASVLRPNHCDYEDGLLLAVAERAKLDHIITGDKGLLSNPVVSAMNPRGYLEAYS